MTTPAQHAFIRRLWDERARANPIDYGYSRDHREVERLTTKGASDYIDRLLAQKAAGWPRAETPMERDVRLSAGKRYAHFLKPDGTEGTMLVSVWERVRDDRLRKGYKLIRIEEE